MSTTKYPPALTLAEAVRVVSEMYAQHKSREISADLMPDIFRVKQSSSYFPAKIAALQKFGFAEKHINDQLYLTDRAMMIVDPVLIAETHGAKLEAAKEIDVLKELCAKYPNFQLPSADQLKQYLMKSFGIIRDTVEKWYDFVVESFRELAVDAPKSVASSKASGEHENWLQETRAKPEASRPLDRHFQNIQLPSGSIFEFSLPENVTIDDLNFAIGFFELRQKVQSKDAEPK